MATHTHTRAHLHQRRAVAPIVRRLGEDLALAQPHASVARSGAVAEGAPRAHGAVHGARRHAAEAPLVRLRARRAWRHRRRGQVRVWGMGKGRGTSLQTLQPKQNTHWDDDICVNKNRRARATRGRTSLLRSLGDGPGAGLQASATRLRAGGPLRPIPELAVGGAALVVARQHTNTQKSARKHTQYKHVLPHMHLNNLSSTPPAAPNGAVPEIR